jgi:hypothetical protein
MKGSKPKTRSEATKPAEFQHLSAKEQQAIELGAEAEHATGKRREELIRKSKRTEGSGQD